MRLKLCSSFGTIIYFTFRSVVVELLVDY
jgi:hypothetical protein